MRCQCLERGCIQVTRWISGCLKRVLVMVSPSSNEESAAEARLHFLAPGHGDPWRWAMLPSSCQCVHWSRPSGAACHFLAQSGVCLWGLGRIAPYPPLGRSSSGRMRWWGWGGRCMPVGCACAWSSACRWSLLEGFQAWGWELCGWRSQHRPPWVHRLPCHSRRKCSRHRPPLGLRFLRGVSRWVPRCQCYISTVRGRRWLSLALACCCIWCPWVSPRPLLQTAWQVYVLSCNDVLDRVIGCPASCGMLTGLDGASFVWATCSRPVPVWGEPCCP